MSLSITTTGRAAAYLQACSFLAMCLFRSLTPSTIRASPAIEDTTPATIDVALEEELVGVGELPKSGVGVTGAINRTGVGVGGSLSETAAAEGALVGAAVSSGPVSSIKPIKSPSPKCFFPHEP